MPAPPPPRLRDDSPALIAEPAIQAPGSRGAGRRRLVLAALQWPLWSAGLTVGLAAGPALASGADLTSLSLQREDGALLLEFAARLSLSRAVEEALHHGVPLYFTAEATVYRGRWYWRDQRVARARRTWRLAFQPLTSTWRVGLGALTQSYASLPEAISALSGTGRWRIADLSELEPGARHYLDFSYQLDTSQLPSPMQIGIGTQAEWVLRVERELPLPP